MINKFLLSKLHTAYDKHESIIIAVDFDDTIVPSCPESIEQCNRTREVLEYVHKCIKAKVIIYTARKSNITNYQTIAKYCDYAGVHYDTINENILEWYPSPSKLYFNILLDDKAGLTECQDTLEQFVNEVLAKNINE